MLSIIKSNLIHRVDFRYYYRPPAKYFYFARSRDKGLPSLLEAQILRHFDSRQFSSSITRSRGFLRDAQEGH